MWKKIEDKVEIKIGQKLAQYHVERLYTEVFRVLERRVANAESFDSDDLEIILDKGLMVFPQNYKSLGWSYDLPLAILNWMPFMIAGYQHQIKKDEQPVYVNIHTYTLLAMLGRESKKDPAFEKLLLPECKIDYILQYLIEEATCLIIFRTFFWLKSVTPFRLSLLTFSQFSTRRISPLAPTNQITRKL